MRQAGLMQPIVGGDGYDTPLLLSVGGKAATTSTSRPTLHGEDSTPGS